MLQGIEKKIKVMEVKGPDFVEINLLEEVISNINEEVDEVYGLLD